MNTFSLKNFITKISKTIISLLFGAILIVGVYQNASAQCLNSSAFGTAAINTSGAVVTLTTCAFGGEFSTCTGITAGMNVQFNATGGASNYITIRHTTSGGTVVAFGTPPLTITAPVTGSYFVHVNTSAAPACGTDGSCHTVTAQLILPPCTPPVDQATSLTAGTITASSIGASFTAAASAPSGYLIVRYPTGATPTNPVNGTTYVAGNALGTGTVVQAGAGLTFNATGLVPSTTYDFYVYSYNVTPSVCIISYNTTSPLMGSFTTSAPSMFTSTTLGGLWTDVNTWVGGVVPPSANNVTIATGAVVTVNTALTYNNLIVDGTLQWGTVANAVTLTGDLTINSTGRYLGYINTGAATGTITIGGNFKNDGFANLANCPIVFNKASGAVTFDGTGTFTTDQLGRGLLNNINFAGLGTFLVNTTQNLVCRAAMANTGSFNPNGKLSCDATAVYYGQASNIQVLNGIVTAHGSGYTVAPVVVGTGCSRWIASSAVTAGQFRFSGTNVYTCAVAGTTSATAPTHTSGTATDGTVTWLWIGNVNTIGTGFQSAVTPTVGTYYFYGANLYQCVVAGLPSSAAPPVHTSGVAASGAASYRYVGSPAQFSVVYDGTSTVRALTMISGGSGYTVNPAAINIATVNGAGSGATATCAMQLLVGAAAGSVFNQQMGVGASYTSAFNALNHSQGVNSVSVATAGVNYSVAPQIGFGFPTSLNLVTAGGSGYTTTPTVTISGGTNVTGFANPTFTVTVNQGKVVSVYASGGGSGWLTPPTLTLTGGGGSGATIAFPAGCLATATPIIGSNGSITNFTITNSGFGYVGSPTSVIAGGTFTTAAATPVARVGLYGITYAWFAPATAPTTINTGNEIPTSRIFNQMTINNANNQVVFTGNVTLTGTAPTTWSNGMVNMSGNSLTYTWNGYAGANLISPNFGVRNASITLTGRGGGTTGSTWSFPFINGSAGSFTAFTGSGTDGSNGSDITSMTVTDAAAPSGGSPGNQPIGSRSFRVQTPSGTVYGASPNVRMRWNPSDSIDGTAFPTLTNQSDLYIGESNAVSGPTWTIRSNAYGAGGLVPQNGELITSASAPGPIANTTNKYYAYISTQVPPTITSFSPTEACADAGIITINGTGFKNITAANVTIGGTPVASIISYSTTQIIANVGAGTTGPVAVTTSGGTATTGTNFTVTTLAGIVAPTRTPANGLVCNTGGSVALDATQTVGPPLSYNWTGAGLSSTTIPNPTASPSTTTQYRVDIDLTVCTASYFVNVGVLPPFTFTPSSAVDTLCFTAPDDTIQMNANLSSSGFTVTSTPYVVYTPPAIGTTTLVQGGIATPALTSGSLDDGGWASIPLGFSYNFFGNVYSTVNVGTNGILQFGAYNATSLGDFTYATPFPTTSEPTNVIALMANDLWFNNAAAPGTIKYWNEGIAPTRKFIIQYANVNTCCGIANPLTTVTAVLYETIGNVEIHITSTLSTLSKTVGLQDLTGTIGAVAPGRGSFTGTITTPEAWKFVPPANYTYAWTGTGLTSTSIVNPKAVITTSPTSNYDNYTYSVVATNPITGCSATGVDSFKIFQTPTAPTATNSTECSNPVIPTCSVMSTSPAFATHTFKWYTQASGGTAIQTGTSTTYTGTLTETDTFYVSEVNGNCESPRVMVIATVPQLVLTTTPSPALICNVGGSVTLSVVPTMMGSTIAWTGGPNSAPSSATTNANPTTTTLYTVTETLGACLLTKSVGVGVLSPVPVLPTATPNPVMSCTDTIQLNANLSGTSFTIIPTTYGITPVPMTGVTTLCNNGATPTTLTSGSLDDGGWGAIPIGFTYNFLGTNFTNVNVGTNGVIHFGPYNAGALGDFTYVGLPSTTEPFNIIAGCATDLYLFTSGKIRTFTTGIAPLRKFVIDYDSVPGFTTNGIQSFQIVLYETTGIAEVHTTFATKNGAKTVGTNNGDGTVGAAAPGRNGYVPPITSPEAWRFNPPAAYTYTWSPSTGLSSTSIMNPKLNPIALAGTYPYTVAVTNPITGCPSNGTVNIIRQYPSDTIFDTITSAGAYLFNTVYRNTTGFYRDTLINGSGCDSILVLRLQVVSPGTLYLNDNMCNPMSVTSRYSVTTPYSSAGFANLNPHTDTIYQSNRLATMQASEPIGSCGSSGINNKTMWYTLKAPFCATPSLHISTDDRDSTNFNTRVSVYRRNVLTSCTGAYTEIACNDDAAYYLNSGATNSSSSVLTPNSATSLTTPLLNEYAPGEDLYVQVSGVGALTGKYGLIIDAEPYVPTASNVRATMATINWSPIYTNSSTWGPAAGAYVQWRPVGAASTVAGTWRYVAAPIDTLQITGLMPNTAYEFWASYPCGNGGRWWSKKSTFTTPATCTGTSPTISSVAVAPSSSYCNSLTTTFMATDPVYTYRVIRKRVSSSTFAVSPLYNALPTAQTWLSAGLAFGETYEFWVVAFCAGSRSDSSGITSFTVCSSARTSAPTEDKDVVYILPNGDHVYGMPVNLIDLPIDMNNPGEQEITLQTIDANTYFGTTTESTGDVVVAKGDVSIYPNPASTEATISYTLAEKAEQMNIRVVDAQGKEMMNRNVQQPAESGEFSINLNNYSGGIYFVKIQAGDFTTTKKLVVEKN